MLLPSCRWWLWSKTTLKQHPPRRFRKWKCSTYSIRSSQLRLWPFHWKKKKTKQKPKPFKNLVFLNRSCFSSWKTSIIIFLNHNFFPTKKILFRVWLIHERIVFLSLFLFFQLTFVFCFLKNKNLQTYWILSIYNSF